MLVLEKLAKVMCEPENEFTYTTADGKKHECYRMRIVPVVCSYGITYPKLSKSIIDTILYYKCGDVISFFDSNEYYNEIPMGQVHDLDNLLLRILDESFGINHVDTTLGKFINWTMGGEDNFDTEESLSQTLKITDFLRTEDGISLYPDEAAKILFPNLNNPIRLFYVIPRLNYYDVYINVGPTTREYITTVTKEPMSKFEEDDDMPY